MGEYAGRIDLSKDTMLFVTNLVFGKDVKESTTKENILKLIPEIYTEENYEKIVRMLPYKGYLALEDLVEYLKTGSDIKEFLKNRQHIGARYLEEAMIIVRRVKYGKSSYSLNPGVVEKLEGIFSDKYKRLAERYAKIEKLTLGILYSYGVIEAEFFRKLLCRYMNCIMTTQEIEDICFERLNLNYIVDAFCMGWTNDNTEQNFITYLNQDEVDVARIATEQKSRGLNYKKFSEKQILEREEYLWNTRNKKLYEYVQQKGAETREWPFQRLLKRAELGENIIHQLLNMCNFGSEDEMQEFVNVAMNWHNNTPQYVLGGYTPNELMDKYMNR